jgi:hypothetical protein
MFGPEFTGVDQDLHETTLAIDNAAFEWRVISAERVHEMEPMNGVCTEKLH